MEIEDTLAAGPSTRPEASEDEAGSASAPAALTRGTQLGRYTLLDMLGAGGMGMVHAGYDPELDRKIALKLVRPKPGRDAKEERARLLREAQALAKLSHPNVVAIHDVGTHGEWVWIAMEFVRGQTLGAWAESRPHKWQERLDVLLDAARGVAAAHAAGLVHRDLKPDNVMIAQDGRARVMDFGLARGPAPAQTGEDGGATDPGLAATLDVDAAARPQLAALDLKLTRTGMLKGTPAYMAPEQWDGRPVEAATDQFGWSVMAWELLYGSRPFDGETLAQLAAAVLAGQRQPVPRGARVPGWLRRIVDRGLRTDPRARWPSMEALVEAIEKGRRRARNRWGVALGMLGTVVGIGAIMWPRVERGRAVAACEAAGAEIEALWNDPVRQRVRDAVVTFGGSTPLAEERIRGLDERAAQWQQARTEACLQSQVHERWSEDTTDRALWCLDDLRMRLEVVLSELAKADTMGVPQVLHEYGATLRPADMCVDEAYLLRQPKPPAQDREEILAIHRQSVEVTMLGLQRSTYEASERARALRERAERLGWAPLLADARLAEGIYGAFFYGDESLGAMGASEAYFMAIEGKDWATAADAATWMISFSAADPKRWGGGHLWGRLAEVAIEESGDRLGVREGLRLQKIADLELADGRDAEARVLLERALERLDEALGPESIQASRVREDLAHVHLRAGEHARARALFEQVIATREQAMGPHHNTLSEPLRDLGSAYWRLGDRGKARALYERAFSITVEGQADHPLVAQIHLLLVRLMREEGQHAQALPRLEQALTIAEARSDGKMLELAARAELADTLWVTGGDRARAVAQARLARDGWAELAKTHADAAEHLAKVERWLAEHPLGPS